MTAIIRSVKMCYVEMHTNVPYSTQYHPQVAKTLRANYSNVCLCELHASQAADMYTHIRRLFCIITFIAKFLCNNNTQYKDAMIYAYIYIVTMRTQNLSFAMTYSTNEFVMELLIVYKEMVKTLCLDITS